MLLKLMLRNPNNLAIMAEQHSTRTRRSLIQRKNMFHHVSPPYIFADAPPGTRAAVWGLALSPEGRRRRSSPGRAKVLPPTFGFAKEKEAKISKFLSWALIDRAMRQA
jgi:hypothetical protein